MFSIPFVGGHTRGRSDYINAQECINWYPDLDPSEVDNKFSLIPTPGLELITSTPNGAVPRAAILHKGDLYIVADNDFYQYSISTGVWTDHGDLNTTGTGRVSMASSGIQGGQILIADGQSVYVFYDTDKSGNITGVSNANPAVVTSFGHGLVSGDKIAITGVASSGTPTVSLATLVNTDHIITKVDDDTFSLNGIDTSSADTYTSGGTWDLYQFFEPGLGTDTGFLDFSSASNVDHDTGAITWGTPTGALADGGAEATLTGIGDATATAAAGAQTELSDGDNSWISPGNITGAGDNSYASAPAGPLAESNTLYIDQFGISINAKAVVQGIQLDIHGAAAGTNDAYITAQIVNESGTAVGEVKTDSFSGTAETTVTMGGPTDLWTISALTGAQVSDVDFGFYIQAPEGHPTYTLRVDNVVLTVYYSLRSDYLRLQDHTGAALATSDVVTGIEINVEKEADAATTIYDHEVHILKSGGVVGNNRASAIPWTTADASTVTYGGAADLWGSTFSPADVNSTNFGFQISAGGAEANGSASNAQIDYARVKIYYNTTGVVPASFAAWADSYFIINDSNSGKFYITDQGGQLWDTANDFATAERDPDKILALAVNRRELWLLGDDSTEVWYNSGDIFPWSPVNNAFSEWGIASPHTLAKADDHLLWLARNKQGTHQVVMTQGYRPTVISPSTMSAELAQYTNLSGATAFSYQQNGHTFYVLNFTKDGATWVYDLMTRAWHRRSSKNSGRALPELLVFDGADHYVTAFNDANVYKLKADVFSENGNTIYRVRTTQRVSASTLGADQAGRNYVYFRRFILDAATGSSPLGQGPEETRPRVGLSWSDDDGQSWTAPIWRELGQPGEAVSKRLQWQLLGASRERIFRVETESVGDIIISDAYIDAQIGTR